METLRSDPKTLHASEAVIDFIRGFEGWRGRAYYCSAGRPTIGYGHTASVTRADVDAGRTILRDEGEALFRADIAAFERLIQAHVTVPLLQGEFNGLLSILFNIGPGRKAGATGPEDAGRDGIIRLKGGQPSGLLTALNAGDYAGAQTWFTAWRSRGKSFESGQLRRRLAEALMFEGLPWRRASSLTAVTLTTTLDDARRLALEEADDIAALETPKPAPVAAREPTVTIVADLPVADLHGGDATDAPIMPPPPPPPPTISPPATAPVERQAQADPPRRSKHPAKSKTLWGGLLLALLPDLVGIGNMFLGVVLAGELGDILKVIGLVFVVVGRFGAAAAPVLAFKPAPQPAQPQPQQDP